MFNKVVLPEPVPPEIMMFKRDSTHAFKNCKASEVIVPNWTSCSIVIGFLANLRIVITGPTSEIGGIIAFKAAGNTQENMVTTNGTKVKLETSKGDIVIQLYDKQMPITAGNFKKLVQQGFYDNLIFHRVISGFMIQGGDPEGTGAGGPGYTIKDEYTGTNLDQNLRGTIAMAKSQAPNSAGSQFFINLVDNHFLDGKYSVFGKVVSGMDVVDSIATVKTDSNDKPLTDVKIIKATII